MRIAFVVHGFPPHEHTGVENHVAALAKCLARRGISIEVFSPRADPTLQDFAQRREERDGYGLTWVIANRVLQSAAEHQDPPGMAAAFGEFLDRVRPLLVHVHHVQKVGVGVFEEAARRGIPSLYTAHDYFPVCHRTILARPDLSRCSSLGDSRACARCDLALSYLNDRNRWSDFQAGVSPGALLELEQRELAQRLDPAANQSQHTAVFDERARLDRQRRRAFDRTALLLAPTEFLRSQLIAGGHDSSRIELCAYGIETESLSALAPPRDGSKGPLTFGYIGGAHRHKGLHVLLDAYASLSLPARLVIHADSTDRDYVAQMRARAASVGAHWNGAFSAAELPRVMDGIDVLVVPSIWWENAPFAIREAFAASRPVISSDLPALRESVSDGIDGLLVAPGDPAALRLAMERLVGEPELAARLAGNIRAPRSLDELGDELVARYAELISEQPRSLPPLLPASVRPFAERLIALEALNVDELRERAQALLAPLASMLGVEPSAARAADLGPLALERLNDARRENAWRVERDALRGAQLEAARLHAEQQAANRSELMQSHRRAVEDGEQARAALLRAERALASRANELSAAALAQAAARAALEREEGAHAQARAALERCREAGAELLARETRSETARAGLERALEGLRIDVAAAEQRSAQLETELLALTRHAQWLESESANLVRRFGNSLAALCNADDVRAAHETLDRLQRELDWRRGEMRALREDGGLIIRALVEHSALGRRIHGWEREG